ncbi:MAG TPA: hypothetical protein VL651_09470 [Bacteroidia bacterium]|nr:hypothetical protein [Bacteroidia bacterium]
MDNIELPSDFDDLSKHAPALHELRNRTGEFVLPENYFGEHAELISALTSIPSAGEFIVPENYFEELAEKIISLANISAIKDKEGFELPEGYFEKFADDITSTAELHSITHKDGFNVPVNYFGEFDAELNTKIALDNLKQDEGFNVPDNYFDKFTERIVAQASLEDAIDKLPAVPEKYFDTLADRITARIKAEGHEVPEAVERGKVIVFAEVIKRYARPVAIAASAALLIAAAFWFLNKNEEPGKKQLAKNEQHVPKILPAPVVAPAHKDSVVTVNTVPQNIAQQTAHPKKHKPQVNQQSQQDVQLAKNDIMEQSDLLDVNTVADFINTSTDIDLSKQTITTDPSIDADVINSNLDVNDILNGVNNQ